MEQTVLIIDDEESIRDMVQMALELEGYRCLQAANAREGHAAILDDKPNSSVNYLIFKDIKLLIINCAPINAPESVF